MKEKIINMTPHNVDIIDDDGYMSVTFPPSGELIRLSQKTERIGTICGVPVVKTTFGAAEGLPYEEEGTYYIVSAIVKNAFPNRKDLLVPAEMVRDAAGNIIGCKSLSL